MGLACFWRLYFSFTEEFMASKRMQQLAPVVECIREYRFYTIITPVLVMLEVFMGVLIPRMMAQMIDLGITPGNTSVILRVGGQLLLVSVLALAMGVGSGWTAVIAATGFSKNLRQKTYYAIQDFSFLNIDHFSTSSLVTRTTTDINNVQQAFQMLTRIAVRAPIMLFSAVFMAFQINARMSLVFVVAIPVLGAGMIALIRKAHPLFQKIFGIYDNLNRVVQENIRGIRVVKSYVREDYEEEKFKLISGDIYNRFARVEKMMALMNPLMQTTAYTCILVLSWLGAKMIVAGDLTTGELTGLITYTTQILMSLMMLSMIVVMLTMSQAALWRIAEVLTEKSDITSPEKDAVTTVQDGSIRFENVGFSYSGNPEKLSVMEVDLDIGSGQTIGILGGTGSGKSTLVQLIPRLYETTKGRVLVGGRDVREYDLNALRNQVAMVLQKNELFSGTIKENLRWGNPSATDEQLVRACELAQADTFIRAFPDGYDTYIEQGGSNVSGGQKQRLCIARALLKEPKILILDDSTSAIDTRTDALIRKAFTESIPNTTKLIIAQRVASIEHADQIVVMDGGRVNAIGTHEELLQTSEIYREVYQSQKKGDDENGAV